MPRKGENIYKRKDGRWEGRYIKGRDGAGRAKYGYVYGKSYREVKEKKGKLPMQEAETITTKSQAQPLLFQDLLEQWIAVNRDKNKQSTFVKYHNLIYRHITPELGNYQIHVLNTRMIQQFTQKKLERGRLDQTGGLSEKTVRDILGIIKAALRFAQEEYPAIAPSLKVVFPREPLREIRVLSSEEQKALEHYLLRELDISKLGVYVCLYTGLRLGEICALRWEDILVSEGILWVRRTLQRIQNIEDRKSGKTQVVISQPKSRCSFREIPLPNFLADCITPFCPAEDGGYFLTGTKGKFMEPRTYQNRFQSYLRQIGISGVSFHALRHTFATRCVEAGFDVKSLSEILGHANVGITLTRYVHPSRSLKRANMDKLKSYNCL